MLSPPFSTRARLDPDTVAVQVPVDPEDVCGHPEDVFANTQEMFGNIWKMLANTRCERRSAAPPRCQDPSAHAYSIVGPPHKKEYIKFIANMILTESDLKTKGNLHRQLKKATEKDNIFVP